MFDQPSFGQHERAACAHDAGTGLAGAAEIDRIPIRLAKFFARSSASRFTSQLADGMAHQLLAEAR